VLGREELDKLAIQKQALLVESGMNRLALQAELNSLRSGTTWLSTATGGAGKFTSLLPVVASVAGFLLARRARRSGSRLSQAAAVLKWIGPLYGLWQWFSARRRRLGSGQSAA
jgi:hypothetical protein